MIDIPAARAIIAGSGVKGPLVAVDNDVHDAYGMTITGEDGGMWSMQIAAAVALAVNTLPAALDECERLAANVEDLRESVGYYAEARLVTLEERDDVRAEVATLRAALVEACDLADHGWEEDHSRLRAVHGANIARLRALAAGGAG